MSIDVLQEKIRKLKNPSMVTLCPEFGLLPPQLVQAAFDRHGQTLAAAAAAYERFCTELLDALEDIVPAVNIESGCFAALGADGVAAMQRVLQYAAGKEYYVLLDSMRSDLPPAVQPLADACFGQIRIGENAYTPYPCDGVVVSPYLGSDGVLPYTEFCEQGKNVFLPARTSNKSAREVQDQLSGDRMFYQVMAEMAMRWTKKITGRYGYSEVGIIVGLTNPDAIRTLRSRYDRLFLLVPGFGTQGGLAKNAQYAFDRMGHGAAVLAGRSILYAYAKKDSDGSDYLDCARAAALQMREKILAFMTVI